MGGDGEFALKDAGKELKLQFIVDFSQTTGCEKDLSLSLTAGNKSSELKLPMSKEAKVTVKDVLFGLADKTASDSVTLTRNLTWTYASSDGAASKWDGRAAALVLTLKEGNALPADAHLSVKIGGTTTVYYMKGKNRFIIPLSANSGEIALTLQSAMIPADRGTYTFTAYLYGSNSLAGSAPLNGTKCASIDVTFEKAATTSPSLKITGTQRVATISGQMTVNIKTLNTNGCTIKATLLQKNGDNYVSTGQSYAVTGGELKLSFRGQQAGASCLEVTVIDSNKKTLLRVPYYFILLDG
jgi:hypothetical protein